MTILDQLRGRTLRIRVRDIGKPRRTHTVELLEDPVPRELPRCAWRMRLWAEISVYSSFMARRR
jgi:hypothetical protein